MGLTFGLDVLACPRCGGRLIHVATILDARVACRNLANVRRPARAAPELPARDPPPFWESGGRVGLTVAMGARGCVDADARRMYADLTQERADPPRLHDLAFVATAAPALAARSTG